MRQHHFSMLIVSFAAAMAVFFGWPNEPPVAVSLALATLALIILQYGEQRVRPRVRRAGLVLLDRQRVVLGKRGGVGGRGRMDQQSRMTT